MNFNNFNEWLVGIEGSDIPTKLFKNLKHWQISSYVYIDHINKATNSIVLNCTFQDMTFNLNIPYPIPVDNYQSFYHLFLDCLSEQYPELLI